MAVKAVVGDLEDVGMEEAVGVHGHNNGISVINITGQDHGFSVKADLEDGGIIILILGLTHTACVIQNQGITAIGGVEILYGVKNLELYTADSKDLAGVLFIVLGIGEKLSHDLHIVCGSAYTSEVVHDVLYLKLAVVLL